MSAQPGTTASDVLERLLQTLRWHGATIVVVVVAAAVAGGLLARGLPDEYEAEAIVALAPADDRGTDASLIRLRAPTYVSYLLADATHREMAGGLGGDAVDELGDVRVDLVSDTGTIVVTAVHPDPERAVELAEAVVDQAVAFSSSELHLLVEVVAPPVVPGAPAGPARKLIVAAVLLAAAVLAVGGALLWDQVRPRLRDAASLARLTGSPALVEVPRRRRVSPRLESTDPGVAAAVRVLRTHLDSELHLPTTLAVLSAVRGEGRTTIAALLGQSLADLDARVLLVDADVDRRGLGRALGVEHNESLSRVLSGQEPASRAITATDVPGVSLVAADAAVSPDAMARGIARLLSAVREQYDVVLVDTPPLLGGDLARTIAIAADEVVVVAAVGTPVPVLERATAALDNLRVRPVGSVVNRGRGRRLA